MAQTQATNSSCTPSMGAYPSRRPSCHCMGVSGEAEVGVIRTMGLLLEHQKDRQQREERKQGVAETPLAHAAAQHTAQAQTQVHRSDGQTGPGDSVPTE